MAMRMSIPTGAKLGASRRPAASKARAAPARCSMPALRSSKIAISSASSPFSMGASRVSAAFNPLRLPRAGKAPVVPQATAAAVAVSDEPVWKGASPIPFLGSIGIGLAIRYLVPIPVGVTVQAWTLLSIFMSTITGLVLSPLPVGAWAFCMLTFTVVTKTLTFQQAFAAFTNDVIWLIVISFFFARGFVKTGLGDRVATIFVKLMGKSTLGLAYGLSCAEAIIAPAMPSTTARAGGVFLPIIQSLALSNGSKPGDESSKKLGAFLIQSQFQSSNTSSSLYLTGAAQNLLCLKLAAELGVVVASPFVTWLKMAALPSLVSLLLTPLLVYKLFPPEIKDTPEAPAAATKKLEEMGPLSRDEGLMVATMGIAVTLWVCGDAIGISSCVAAMIGLTTLLLTGVLSWADCLNETSAWDTLAWFAVLVGMSGQLNALGLVKFMADSVAGMIAAANMAWPQVFVLLNLAYFGAHYIFASQTAHVGALYAGFCAMMLASGVPPVMAALSLAINTNLFGAISHYSSGQAAVYFGSNYVGLPDTFKMGAIFAVFNLVNWFVVGGLWWKFLGVF